MIKKVFALLAALLLLAAYVPALGEEIIINKIKNPDDPFEFDPDAKLLEVYFPEIFGVDAAYVRYGDYGMLIDCAGFEWELFDTLLNDLGVTHVNYAVNSHPDADHIGGFNRVLKHIACDEFVLGFPEDYEEGDEMRFAVYKALHEMNIPFHQVSNGDTLEFGDVKVSVLQRTDDHLVRTNNRSVMLMIELGERRIFFTGDIQADTQNLLSTETDLDLHADILKYPHHGYNNMRDGFLKKVDPKMVVITGGSTLIKGKEILDRYKIKYVFTLSGALRFATDGKVWTVERVKK